MTVSDDMTEREDLTAVEPEDYPQVSEQDDDSEVPSGIERE